MSQVTATFLFSSPGFGDSPASSLRLGTVRKKVVRCVQACRGKGSAERGKWRAERRGEGAWGSYLLATGSV
jgi:hypothetical protein